MSVHCDYYDAGRCRSCVDLPRPYAEQLQRKQARLRDSLAECLDLQWLDPVASAQAGFRNKAKMAVSGSIDAPQLGLAEADGRAEDLSDCLLYPPALRQAFAPIKQFIRATRIEPYDIRQRRGELKFVLLTIAEHSGELMLRLVLRSREALGRITARLPELQAALPRLRVVSVNLQPLPAAIVEGAEEIVLTSDQHLRMVLNEVPIYLRPRGFFQTNTRVAAALYRQAQHWIAHCDPAVVWDLYCGAGGFALHCADGTRDVLGIELSAEAVDGARRAALELGIGRLHFEVRDAAHGLDLRGSQRPDLVIVNPPRRGIGEALCAELESSDAQWLVYSSCNPDSLRADLRRLTTFKPRIAQLLDMFPHTEHAETLVLLARSGQAMPHALANAAPAP